MTTREKIFSKLTSRKFWLAVVSFVAMIMIYRGASEDSATQVASIIMAGATLIAYIIGEGFVDSCDDSDTYIAVDGGEYVLDDEEETEAEG